MERRCRGASKRAVSGPQVRVAATDLERFCADIFSAVGVPSEQAVQIAENLVDADLKGIESHGVLRVPQYVRRIEAGVVNPNPKVTLQRDAPATAVADGDNGMGQIVSLQAMELVIDKASKGIPAFVAVGNSNHFGAAGYYAERAVGHGMIGIATTIGGINHMLPWGGAEPMPGNNPFAFALPGGEAGAVVLDMACSVAARGKIMAAAKAGREIPADWSTDAQGRPTTDPVRALEGYLQPVGGAKGYALTLTIGLLSTMLCGAGFGSEVTDWLHDLERPQNIGHLFGAIPVTCFEDMDVYRARMDKAAQDIRGVKRAPGAEQIYLPGERERLLAAQRRREGLALSAGVASDLEATGARYGVLLRRMSEA